MNRIVIITTPFHLKQLIHLKEELKLNAETAILHSNFVNKEILCPYFKQLNSTLYSFQSDQLQLQLQSFRKRFTRVLSNPADEILKYRKVVSNCVNFLNPIIKSFNSCNDFELIIFNDRDLLAQLAIKLIKDKATNFIVTAIDEGTGFYIRENFRHKTLKWIYRIISRYLLGFDYKFIEQYGTHPDINRVYIRYPNLLPFRHSNISYYEISAEPATEKIAWNLRSPSLILFSTLLSEEGFCSEEREFQFYSNLASVLGEKGIGLVVKHHPRENKQKIKAIHEILENEKLLKYEVVDTNVHGEQIDLEKCSWILNFGSSVILPLINSGTLNERIITIKLNGAAFADHIFDKTTIVKFDQFEDKLRKLT